MSTSIAWTSAGPVRVIEVVDVRDVRGRAAPARPGSGEAGRVPDDVVLDHDHRFGGDEDVEARLARGET
jgi:hypothetical protein